MTGVVQFQDNRNFLNRSVPGQKKDSIPVFTVPLMLELFSTVPNSVPPKSSTCDVFSINESPLLTSLASANVKYL